MGTDPSTLLMVVLVAFAQYWWLVALVAFGIAAPFVVIGRLLRLRRERLRRQHAMVDRAGSQSTYRE